MSRIGKLPIVLADGVQVKIAGSHIDVEGSKGKLSLDIANSDITAKVEDNKVIVERANDLKETKAAHGLYRVLINNMVIGVSKGYEKKLEIVGTGYKATVSGQDLVLNLGFSHDVKYPIPAGIKIAVEEGVKLTVSGIDKELVGHVSSQIRKYRPPEPYKGKGVKYADERIRRKAGKAAKK